MKLFAILFLGMTIAIMINTEVKGQSKKDPTITNINTASPVFDFIYVGEEGDGAVRIQIHDRLHQFVSMGYDRLADQAKGNDPKNPLIKLIQIPEIDPLAFRQAETLEEAKLQVDGITVLSVKLNLLREAALVWYR